MKHCSQCKETKKLEEFYDHPKTADKKFSICRTCCRINYNNNPNRVANQYRSCERYPDRRRARQIAQYALKKGILVRQQCKCGSEKAQMHHENYAQPLSITWLCSKCHAKEDKLRREKYGGRFQPVES